MSFTSLSIIFVTWAWTFEHIWTNHLSFSYLWLCPCLKGIIYHLHRFSISLWYIVSGHITWESVVCSHWPAPALRLMMSVFLCFLSLSKWQMLVSSNDWSRDAGLLLLHCLHLHKWYFNLIFPLWRRSNQIHQYLIFLLIFSWWYLWK